jgi:S-(hydroxymethyl)glutathione dehydrogenase/alcohol dehydrogenase
MRAAVLTEIPSTKLLVVDDVELRPIQPGDVQIRVAHSGVCHSDLSVMNGTIPGDPPMVMGHEGSGVVTDVGDGVTHVEPGDHVIVAFSPPCGACAYCNERAQANLCITGLFTMLANTQFTRGGSALGSMSGCGTFAEHTIVPAIAAIKIEKDIPLDVAALVGCSVTTGVGAALNGAKVTPGSSVVVIGCGGVGIAAIQGARIAGAEMIVAIDLHEAKLDRARAFGATHTATPDDIEAVKNELTAGEGFDFAIEAIGRAATMRQAYDLIRRGGTACVVGVGPSDEYLQLNAFEQIFNEKTVVGSMYGSSDVRTDFERFLGLYRDGQLDLAGMISRRLDLAEVNDALHSLGDADVVRQVIDF